MPNLTCLIHHSVYSKPKLVVQECKLLRKAWKTRWLATIYTHARKHPSPHRHPHRMGRRHQLTDTEAFAKVSTLSTALLKVGTMLSMVSLMAWLVRKANTIPTLQSSKQTGSHKHTHMHTYTQTDRQTDRHTHTDTQNTSFPHSLPSLPSPTHPTSILSRTTMISSTQQATRREPSFPSSSMLDVRSAPHWLQHRQQQVTQQQTGMHRAKITPRMMSARMGAYHCKSCAGGEGWTGVSACTCEAIRCVCMHVRMYVRMHVCTYTHGRTYAHHLTMFVYESTLKLAGSVLRS